VAQLCNSSRKSRLHLPYAHPLLVNAPPGRRKAKCSHSCSASASLFMHETSLLYKVSHLYKLEFAIWTRLIMHGIFNRYSVCEVGEYHSLLISIHFLVLNAITRPTVPVSVLCFLYFCPQDGFHRHQMVQLMTARSLEKMKLYISTTRYASPV
jgi:hypothetical protein